MNIMQMMQQAKAMQGKMADMQERVGAMVVTGGAAGGAVSITMTCKGRVEDVKSAAGVLDPADPSRAEDAVKAALNDARARADALMAGESRKLMESMGLPADIKLPF